MIDVAADRAAQRLAAVLDRRTADLARHADADQVRPGLAVLAFAAGAGLYGLAVPDVSEVLPARALAPCPGAAPAVLGLFPHAGRVLAALDPLRLVGAGALERGARGMLLVLRARGRRFAFLVDRAVGVVAVDPPVAAEAPDAVRWVGLHDVLVDRAADTLALLDPARLLAALLNPGA